MDAGYGRVPGEQGLLRAAAAGCSGEAGWAAGVWSLSVLPGASLDPCLGTRSRGFVSSQAGGRGP